MSPYADTTVDSVETASNANTATTEHEFQQALAAFYQALDELTRNTTPFPPF